MDKIVCWIIGHKYSYSEGLVAMVTILSPRHYNTEAIGRICLRCNKSQAKTKHWNKECDTKWGHYKGNHPLPKEV